MRAQRPTPSAPLVALALASAACGLSERPSLPEKVSGHCTYVNKFSNGRECRDYLGDWPEAEMTADCAGQKGTAAIGSACDEPDVQAYCLVPGDGKPMKVAFLGTSAEECSTYRTGCEVFAGGFFAPEPPCGGAAADTGSSLPVFRQPERVCKAPKAGEPAGRSEGGQVCTWQMISGATEPGRRYSDYADCSAVVTQRPYYPAPEDERAKTHADDPRLNDADYARELAWVKSEVAASACVCCHASEAPKGPSNWNLDAPGNFVNGFHDRGVAMGAGWIRSVGFGAYPKEQNNGFTRPTPEQPDGTIFPTTDPERMLRFWLAEAEHRGLKAESFADQRDRASPLDDQLAYKPAACSPDETIGADGTIRWKFGKVRYVYVLEAGARPPVAPPNLDLPEGLLWRVDVPWTGAPIANQTLKYGVVKPGLVQRFPADGAAPKALESGRQYFLYAAVDVAQPVTRCLFTAP